MENDLHDVCAQLAANYQRGIDAPQLWVQARHVAEKIERCELVDWHSAIDAYRTIIPVVLDTTEPENGTWSTAAWDPHHEARWRNRSHAVRLCDVIQTAIGQTKGHVAASLLHSNRQHDDLLLRALVDTDHTGVVKAIEQRWDRTRPGDNDGRYTVDLRADWTCGRATVIAGILETVHNEDGNLTAATLCALLANPDMDALGLDTIVDTAHALAHQTDKSRTG